MFHGIWAAQTGSTAAAPEIGGFAPQEAYFATKIAPFDPRFHLVLQIPRECGRAGTEYHTDECQESPVPSKPCMEPPGRA